MGQRPVWGWGQRERKHPAQEGRGHAWRPWHGEAVNPFEIVAGAVSFASGTGSAVAWDAGEGWVTDAEPGVLLLLPAPRPRQEGSRGVGSSHQVEGGCVFCVLALLPGRVLGFKGASYPVLKVLPAFVGCLHPTRFPSGVSVGDKPTGARHRLVSSTRVSWARVGGLLQFLCCHGIDAAILHCSLGLPNSGRAGMAQGKLGSLVGPSILVPSFVAWILLP